MPIHFDFAFFLTLLVFLTGIVCLVDFLFFAGKRRAEDAKPNWAVEFSRSFFPALLLVWIIRSFVIQPYRVPTGSLEPTILPDDFIAVKQYSYGLRFPISNVKIYGMGAPKHGDIALFRWPVDTSKLFVKRVIGLPGDHITYKNKVLTINGKEMQQKYLGKGVDIEAGGLTSEVDRKQENLFGIVHDIFVKPNENDFADIDVVVPEGYYFMMGDNRDDSDDSRSWGFVPEKFLIGKAFGIWLSWDSSTYRVRWDRIGKAIH